MAAEMRCVTSIYRLELGSGSKTRMVSWSFSCRCNQVLPTQNNGERSTASNNAKYYKGSLLNRCVWGHGQPHNFYMELLCKHLKHFHLKLKKWPKKKI